MRDRKRLFIAVDISKDAKDFFKDFKDRWYDFPGKWAVTENLHITLSFLGNIVEHDLPVLIESIEYVSNRSQPFLVTLEDISFDTAHRPRMIWARVGESAPMQTLYKEMSRALAALPVHVHRQRPHFSAHITLCRFNSLTLQRWHGTELPNMAERVDISLPVAQIHLIESKLRRGGPEHFVLQSFSLGNDSE